MPNVFPNTAVSRVPDIERIEWDGWDKRTRAEDAGLFINVPHSLLQAIIHLEWTFLVDTDKDVYKSHFAANRSSYFTYFESTPMAFLDGVNNTIGTGTGAAGQVITLPAKSVSGLVIMRSDTSAVLSSYTLAASSGPDGEAQITSTGGGFPNGVVLKMTATSALRRHIAYYTTPKFVEEPLEANLYKLTLDLEDKMP